MLSYPEIRGDESVMEDHHGNKILDPFRWLEDPDSDETIKFVEAQNNITDPFLKQCPIYDDMKAKLEKIWDFPKDGCPFREGNRYFHFYNSGLQNQSVWYVRDSLDDEPRVFMDPNTWSQDGTVSLKNYSFSQDGELLAYSTSESGSDWSTIKFLKVSTGEEMSDVLQRVKFSSLSWTHDHKGIFYNMYPIQEGQGTETTSNQDQKLMYHSLGQTQAQDILCHEDLQNPKFLIGSEVTDCGRYLLVSIHKGTEPNHKLFYCDLKDPLQPCIHKHLELHPICDRFEASFSYITNDESVILFKTNLNASMYKIIRIDLNNIQRENWTDLVPTNEAILLDSAVAVHQNDLIVSHLKDVKDVVSVYNLKTGEKQCEIPLPMGSVQSITCKREHDVAFLKFASFLTPGIIYSCDFSQRPLELKTISETKIGNINLDEFKVEQVFYTSKDGTKIPMYIIKHKDLVADGSNPCLLYGYGGFNITLNPSFSITRIFWLKHWRGVYAVANLRGGGEYGRSWHDAGRLKNKQNVFDDFQSAAEYLIQHKYTTAKQLAIMGGSNGGLLVGACMLQRPDLFGAVIAQVGVFDMLRFHKFTIGHAWTSDYGDPDVEEDFQVVRAYSPLHNVNTPTSADQQYPSLLLLTADHDDRVVPLHSLKFIAELQSKCKSCPHQTNPLLIRIECKAGHGAGKPTSKTIEEYRDIFAFLQVTFGLKWHD